MGEIRIGTSGFSMPDWRGVIYPEGLPQKEELVYYQEKLGFDTLEVNSTYYALISEKSAMSMEKKTGKGFEFVVKGFRGFTHDPFDDRLGKGRPEIPRALDDIDRFRVSIRPFVGAGKLGAVLLQYPVFFRPSEGSMDYLRQSRERFGDIPLVIEFRNSEWAKPSTFEFLKGGGMGYCAVDEPKLPRLMPFINEVTSDIGYLRMHGRNRNWFNVPASERYDYLYNDGELAEFLPGIRSMAGRTKKMYILFNNCHAGSAVKNARRTKQLLLL